MSAAVAGAVVAGAVVAAVVAVVVPAVDAAVDAAADAAAAPSGPCSEDVFAAVLASDPALAPSFSVDVDEGPFTLAVMSEISKKREKKKYFK